MQETIVNWQGFESWTPNWDIVVVFALAAAVAAIAAVIRLSKKELEE